MDQARSGHSPHPPAYVESLDAETLGGKGGGPETQPSNSQPRTLDQPSGSKAENNSAFQAVWRCPKDVMSRESKVL